MEEVTSHDRLLIVAKLVGQLGDLPAAKFDPGVKRIVGEMRKAVLAPAKDIKKRRMK